MAQAGSRMAAARLRPSRRAFAAVARIAQPLPSTHPHLLAPGELTPGVPASEYAARRLALAAALPEGAIAVFPSAPPAYMGHDVPHPYHQNTDFFWLTGFLEPSSLVACSKREGEPRWHMFVRPTSKAEEVWDGPRAGLAGAAEHFLPEGDVHATATAGKVLAQEVARGASALYYDSAANEKLDLQLSALRAACAEARLTPRSSARITHRLRLHKSAREQELMRRSASMCAAAFGSVMRGSVGAADRGLGEGTLAAHFEFEVKMRGAERLAYPCVVAGGPNAVALHYMHNDALLQPGQLLLMDAGCSFHGYCSDLTRTWPLSGRYSDAQRAVYEAVLDVNRQCIAACRADGSTSLSSLHRLSLRLTFRHLVALGIISPDDSSGASRCQRYYPHAIGHWLGLDVHDTPAVETSVPLEPGMVITIEPGLYFPLDDPAIPEWCRGIGIRVEDDVLVTDGDPLVLTAAAPKEVADVESALLDGI